MVFFFDYQYVGFIILGGVSLYTIVKAHWQNLKESRWCSSLMEAHDELDTRPASLSPDIRDELDQTPRWWDREFHKLLEASGARYEIIKGDEYTEKSFDGRVLVTYKSNYNFFPECTCSSCKMCYSDYDILSLPG